ncbi:MAG TPA: hypothetical protein PK370_00350 [Candidatus Woesebacteria bacterium]|nr:hypothetical protein [Candidatus Woesebacteria bacterium]
MNKLNKSLVTCALFMTLFLNSGSKAWAQYHNQNNRYSVVIDKTIRSTAQTEFVDNISRNTYVFNENDGIEFRLVVENRSNSVLTNLTVTDNLPKYLSLQYYPGEFDQKNNRITTTIDSLGVGETKVLMIRGRIVNSPIGTNPVALTNFAEVRNQNAYDNDRASYYVASNNIPDTGSNILVLGSVFGSLMALASLGLRKLARGY